MTSKYQILNLPDLATIDQVKASFKFLILQHHPDKHCQRKGKSAPEAKVWQDILDAYETLGNPNLKQIYDSQLKLLLKEGPVQDSVDLDDMQESLVECSNHFQNDSIDSCECTCRTIWTKRCRCGGSFAVSEMDLENGVEFVECDGCSLSIRVLYQQVAEVR